ncbi:response regulator [Denitrobaculum tricleocarpae]|uniref:Response regulator n=1 Tax=Denitrobaculum tricleocarpae TaxID=2591009 RepID=A0A545U1G6_9PROT|nr:response regulator [Denitrobaculum tricleocarpae]TQV83327.1 response regulator [Denitrobaculum tricleocarpae]
MPQVIIVEDEEVLGRNIATALTRMGIEAAVAKSCAVARALIAAASPDLVIADVNLGDGDGIEMLGDWRQDHPDVPVIVMTGQDSLSNRLRAERLDATAFLSKPFAMSRLRELILILLAEGNTGTGPVPNGPSVMMYSHDTIGLGHMRRNASIAAALVERVPNASVLMMVGCPAGMVFELKPGVDFVKLPSLAKLGRNQWRPSHLRVSSDMTRSIRMGILERATDAFRPDILLVDHEPAGVWDELIPMLETLRLRGGTSVILGLRDILDDPARTRDQWEQQGKAQAVRDLYDAVFVYGDERVFPSAEHYGLETLRPGHVTYCGYVTSTHDAPKRKLKGTAPRHILVSGGGGRDAYPVLHASLEALSTIAPDERPDMTLIAGPLMDEELSAPLAQRARELGAWFLHRTSDMPALLDTADLLVTMGGYNSVTEAIAARCPTIVIPRVGPSSEQRLRAECLARLGLVESISQEALSPTRLAERFLQFERTSAPQIDVPLNGADKAAALIAKRLSDMQHETSDHERKTHA